MSKYAGNLKHTISYLILNLSLWHLNYIMNLRPRQAKERGGNKRRKTDNESNNNDDNSSKERKRNKGQCNTRG